MRSGRRLSRVLSFLVPGAVLAGMLAPATAARAVAAYPKVTITSTTAGATWVGLQAVYATVATDPNGTDYPQSSEMFVDGIGVSQALTNCEGNAATKSCAEHYWWDASGQTGTHLAHIVMTTHNGATATADLSITVTSPPPAVSIVSPTEGQTVGGSDVYVDATGTMDPTQMGDYPKSMSLLVDGTVADSWACDLMQRDCAPSFDWVTDGLATGSHILTVTMTTTHGITGTSADRHVNLVTPLTPVVTITSPAAGATVGGKVTVTATGYVDPADGDYPLFMGLFVDDSLTGPIQDCGPGSTCTLSFPWDAGALSGHHTIEVGLESSLTAGFSGPRTVTVVNPPPTVVLTSPLAGSTVNGVTTVTAAGAVDPSQDDFPRNLQLVVDGVVTATSLCTAGGLTCAGSFAWDTAGLVGSHNLQVRFNTLHNSVITVVSAVIVAPRLSAIRLSGVAAVHVGGSGSVRGYLVSPNGGLPIAGAPLTVTFTPANAAPVTVPVKTDASGVFVATYPLPVTAKIAVTVVAPPEYGSSTATGVIPVMTPITCAVPAKAKHGKVTKIVCSSPLLPNGTVVTLRDIDKGTHVVATGKVKNGKVHFAVTFAKKRKYRLDLWATTGSSKLYSPTTSKTYRILVT